jgi:hypothetical protein
MPVDDKVAFYLRHRTLIEEWAALREQAAAELDEALIRAAGIVGQRPDTPEIVKDDSNRKSPVYGISLQVPGAESRPVWVALGWTRGPLLKPSGESWPYTGVKIPGASKGDPLFDSTKLKLRDAASRNQWTQSSGNWVWYSYISLEAGQTDLDAYAVWRVEGLVDAWKALDSEFSGR